METDPGIFGPNPGPDIGLGVDVSSAVSFAALAGVALVTYWGARMVVTGKGPFTN